MQAIRDHHGLHPSYKLRPRDAFIYSSFEVPLDTTSPKKRQDTAGPLDATSGRQKTSKGSHSSLSSSTSSTLSSVPDDTESARPITDKPNRTPAGRPDGQSSVDSQLEDKSTHVALVDKSDTSYISSSLGAPENVAETMQSVAECLSSADRFDVDDWQLERRRKGLFEGLDAAIRTGMTAQGLSTSLQSMGNFKQQPSHRLRLLYQALVGSPRGIDHHRQIYIERGMSTAGLADAVTGCAILTYVFDCALAPGLTFPSWLEDEETRHGLYLLLYKRQLQEYDVDYDAFMREMYEGRLKTPAFRQDAAFRDTTGLATSQVARLLVEHLHGDAKRQIEAFDATKAQLTAWMTRPEDIIADAIFVKCVLSCAQDTFNLSWARSGIDFDPVRMKATHGQKALVLVSAFQGLMMRRKGKDMAVSRNVVMMTSKMDL